MPDDNEDLTTESDNDSDLVRRLRKELKTKSKPSTPEVDPERVSKLERENAFLKAKIDPEDPKAKWFVKGYDGDLAPEAIRKAALEAAIITEAGATSDANGATVDPAKESAMDGLETMRSARAAQRTGAQSDQEIFGAAYQANLLKIKDSVFDPETGKQAVLRAMRDAGIRTTQDF